jgi:hypothetical protein
MEGALYPEPRRIDAEGHEAYLRDIAEGVFE